MPVLHLTIFVSLLLAVVFIVCFVVESMRRKGGNTDRSALLPLLEDDEFEPTTKAKPTIDSK